MESPWISTPGPEIIKSIRRAAASGKVHNLPDVIAWLETHQNAVIDALLLRATLASWVLAEAARVELGHFADPDQAWQALTSTWISSDLLENPGRSKLTTFMHTAAQDGAADIDDLLQRLQSTPTTLMDTSTDRSLITPQIVGDWVIAAAADANLGYFTDPDEAWDYLTHPYKAEPEITTDPIEADEIPQDWKSRAPHWGPEKLEADWNRLIFRYKHEGPTEELWKVQKYLCDIAKNPEITIQFFNQNLQARIDAWVIATYLGWEGGTYDTAAFEWFADLKALGELLDSREDAWQEGGFDDQEPDYKRHRTLGATEPVPAAPAPTTPTWNTEGFEPVHWETVDVAAAGLKSDDAGEILGTRPAIIHDRLSTIVQLLQRNNDRITFESYEDSIDAEDDPDAIMLWLKKAVEDGFLQKPH